MRMRKKYIKYIIVVGVFLVALVVGIFLLNQPQYTILDDISTLETKPIDGVVFNIEADRKAANIEIQNNSDHYIVTDIQQKPIQIEISLEDGWHRILSTTLWVTDPGAIPERTEYALDFKWKDVLGGNLKPGQYRAILYIGDGIEPIWNWFNSVAEFQVK